MSSQELEWGEQARRALILLKVSNAEDVDCETVATEIASRKPTIKEIIEEGGSVDERLAPRAGELIRLQGKVGALQRLAREKGCPGV